ncbi:hypothetical protein ABW21_db0203727 [Orbilia brochopaga]|nr:hypothetical protein ABW21_db0203727 [Drechslerella brochopaga]
MTDVAAPPYTTGGAPPAYEAIFPKFTPQDFAKLPTKEEIEIILKEAESDVITEDEDVEVTIFNTFQQGTNAAQGSLRIGISKPLGIMHHYVAYQATEPGAKWINISGGLEVLMTQVDHKDVYQFIKRRDPKNDYAFDIKLTGYGGEDAHFLGTMTGIAGNTFNWEGFASLSGFKIKVPVTKLNIPKPPNLEGTPEELYDLSPIAQKKEGDVEKDEDGAQKYGDDMWNRISMHALDPETKKTLLPSLPELNAVEKSILNDNPDFFRRYAIHELSERLKKDQKISNEIREHILFKKHWFLKMMTSGSKPAKGDDPLEKYWGVRNAETEKKTDTLRGQYMDVVARCYNEGYVNFCPRIKVYLKEPVYWFKVLKAYLGSPEYTTHLKNSAIASRTNKSINVQNEVLQWGQKLSLLKSAATTEEQKGMELEKFLNALSGLATDYACTYQQVISTDLAQQLRALFQEIESSPDLQKWQELFDSRSKEQAELAAHMKSTASSLLFTITDESTEIIDLIQRRRMRELPPGVAALPQHMGPIRPTFYDIFVELDVLSQTKKLEEDAAKISAMPLDKLEREYGIIVALAEAAEREKGGLPKLPFKERIKTGAQKLYANAKETLKSWQWWGKVIKGALHVAATYYMITNLMTHKGDMKTSEIGMIITHITAFGISAVSSVLKPLFRWIYTKVNAHWAKITTGFIVGWMCNAAVTEGAGKLAKYDLDSESYTSIFTAFEISALIKIVTRFGHAIAGNLKNVLRTAGLVGLVFNLISCYDEMTKVRKLNDDDEKRRKIIATVQFILGIFEGLFLVAEIGFEIAGMFTASALCGCLSIAFGALGVIVLVVYILTEMPTPDKVAKKFLQDHAKEAGSFDENKTVSPEEEPGVKLDKTK